jgi:hypothetical protein
MSKPVHVTVWDDTTGNALVGAGALAPDWTCPGASRSAGAAGVRRRAPGLADHRPGQPGAAGSSTLFRRCGCPVPGAGRPPGAA